MKNPLPIFLQDGRNVHLGKLGRLKRRREIVCRESCSCGDTCAEVISHVIMHFAGLLETESKEKTRLGKRHKKRC